MGTTEKVSRNDEAGFRINVPRQIKSFIVLEVSGYRPGGNGSYAYAYAVSLEMPYVGQQRARYCTHRIYMQDDHLDGEIRWCMEAGNYGFATREEAQANLLGRI